MIWGYQELNPYYYQYQAGKILELYTHRSQEIECQQASSLDEKQLNDLQKSILNLLITIKIQPDNAYAYMMLGKTYCILGKFSEAVQANLAYTTLRPNNPLGYLNLGFAYYLECSKSNKKPDGDAKIMQNNQNLCLNENYKSAITAAFENSGTSANQLQIEAQNAFFNQDYMTSLTFYDLSQILNSDIAPSDRLLWNLSSIIENRTLSTDSSPQRITIYNLEEDLIIQAEDLYLVRSGDTLGTLLSAFPGGNLNYGILWNSGAAVAIIRNNSPNDYNVIFNVQNSAPAPIEFQFEHNFQVIGTASLSQEDMSWSEVSIPLHLEQGYHIIGIRFINDDRVNDIDRNGVIDWIKITK